MMGEKNCHKCSLLEKDYENASMHEKTFLYYCQGHLGVTTLDLKEWCKYE